MEYFGDRRAMEMLARVAPRATYLEKQEDGTWRFKPQGRHDGAFVDLDSSGRYRLVDFTSPGVIVADGPSFAFAASGVPAAQLVSNGDGGIRISTDMSLNSIAQIFHADTERLIVVRDDAPRLRFQSVRARVRAIPRAIALAEITGWGDSMTFGTGALPGGAYLTVLGGETGAVCFNEGIAGQTSAQITARVEADRDRRAGISIFWLGQNNATSDLSVVEDVTKCVTSLGSNDRFLILATHNRTYQYPGHGPEYDELMARNAMIAAAYPANYLDVRSYLVSQYDPSNPEDVVDHSLDIPPQSLRSVAVPGDDDGTGHSTIHLNATGYRLVADRILTEITSKGWV